MEADVDYTLAEDHMDRLLGVGCVDVVGCGVTEVCRGSAVGGGRSLVGM